MATAQDVLRTVVQLDGAAQYQAGMRGMGDATAAAAQKQQVLMQLQTRQAASLGVLGAGLLGLAGQWTKLAGTMEQSRVAFTTLLKSSDRAKQFVKELQQFAATTTFSFIDTQEAATRMKAYGFEVQQIIPMMRILGDSVAALGGGTEKLNRVMLAFGQIRAKGRMMGEEVRQLTEAGIPVPEILKQQLGLSQKDMNRIGEQGISADKALGALLAGMEKRFGGGMAEQAKTLTGQLVNLSDQADILGASLGDGLAGPVKLAASALSALGKSLNALEPAAKSNIGLAVGLSGAIIAIKGAMLGSSAARIGYNMLLAEQARLETQAAAAASANANSITAGGMAAGASAAKRAGSTWMRYGTGAAATAGRYASGVGAAVSAVDAIANWKLNDTGEKINSLGRTVGYTVGAFVPLVGVATALADVMGKIILAGTPDEGKDAGVPYGVDPGTGQPFATREAAEAYYAQYQAEERMRPTKEMGRFRVMAEDLKARARLAGRGNWRPSEEEVMAEIEARNNSDAGEAFVRDPNFPKIAADYAMREQQRRRNQAAMKSPTQNALEGWGFAGKYAEATGDTKGQIEALQQEAQIRRQIADEALSAASSTQDQDTYNKSIKAYQEELLKALGLENEARKLGSDLATKEADATKQSASDRTSLARAYRGYIEATYGEDSPQAAQAASAERDALNNEASLAWQMGDTARAYELATQAVKTYGDATRDMNEQVNKALGAGSAYVEYLRAIGAEKQADEFERTQMAQGQSALAQSLFAQGDVEGGYRAAAAAERYARSGRNGGLFDNVPYANRALTGATYNAPNVNVTVQNNMDLGDGYRQRESKRIQSDMQQSQYWNTFTVG
jgi:tape measure domain-containing protein